MKGFEPIIAANPRILILGSMPSVTSLQQQEYYGFKHNRFWKIISAYFQQDVNNYEDKVKVIKDHQIVLWDVIHRCDRQGSLDSAIRNVVCNDIPGLLHRYPSIQYIICNGKKSYEVYQKHFAKFISIECICMPSTSNANRSIKEEVLYQDWFQQFDQMYAQDKDCM